MTAPGTDVVEANPFLPDDLPEVSTNVEAEVESLRKQAEALIVDDEASAATALEITKELTRRSKTLEAKRVSLTKPRKDAAEEIKGVYDRARKPLDAVGGVLRDKLSDYQAKKKREAEEAQRKIDEERRRVEAEARAKREAAEKAEREAEELRREETDAANVQAAEELVAEERRKAEQAQVMEQAIRSMPPQTPAVAPKLDGFSDRTKREAFIVDRSQLPEFLPDGTPLVVVDMVALRGWMNAQWTETGEAPELPGAEFKRVPAGSSVRT